MYLFAFRREREGGGDNTAYAADASLARLAMWQCVDGMRKSGLAADWQRVEDRASASFSCLPQCRTRVATGPLSIFRAASGMDSRGVQGAR